MLSSASRQALRATYRLAGQTLRPRASVVHRSCPAAAFGAQLPRSFHATSLRSEIYYPAPCATIGEEAPGFSTKAVSDNEIVDISLEQYRGKWAVLLFYPKDWTFVCPTEIIAFSDRHKEFEDLGAQVLAISTDTEDSHLAWVRHPRKRGGLGHMQIPLVADPTKEIAADYGVLIEDKGIALRGLFIINPEGVLEQVTINGLSVGRSVDECLRLIQAHQFVAEHGEVCPAEWKPGDRTMKGNLDGAMEYFSSGATEGETDPLQVGEHVVTISTPEQYREVISKGAAVVDFVAPHCGKCRQLLPFVNELSEQHRNITFAKFDTTDEALSELADETGVKAIPAFRFFRDGKEFAPSITGYKKNMLRSTVEELSKAAA